jgi:predicted flap endonuclease-1-like 5' DNA nuclease
MALAEGFPGFPGFPAAAAVGERAERAWKLPVGAISPLWAMFGAAAGAGIAYWWMTQWTRAVNVEALAGVARIAPPKPAARPIEIIAEPEVEAPAGAAAQEPVAEATAAMTETLAEVGDAALESVAEAAPALEAAIEQAPAPADDLTRMVGIGPKLAVALAARGVTRFAQIAAWTADDLAELDAALSLKGRAVREAWVAQAKRLAAEA